MSRNQDDRPNTHDAAGIGPHTRPGVRLVPLRELDHFSVAEGGADVRGWEVRTVGGRELGKVSELLVDADANEVVMLDIDLHGTDRHTLAPVRAAQIDRTRRVVMLDSADLQDAAAVPSLRRDALPTDEEGQQFHDRYQKAYGARGWDRDRDYQVTHGDHDLEFRRRPHDAEVARRDAQLADATAQDAQRREAERQERERMEAAQRRQAEEARRVEQQRAATAQAQAAGAGAAGATAGRELRWAQGQQQDEEIVVERRPVIEEVIIRRRVVDPNSPEGRQATQQGGALGSAGATGGMGSGAADRATSSGPMDRLADRMDDVKDRFDGNPASRPGPDATDRRI